VTIRDGKAQSISILRQHRGYLMQGGFRCGDYTPDFVKYVQTRVPEVKCAQ